MRLAAAAAVVAVVAVALTGCAPLSSSELQRQAGTVEAVAAEGALLAHQVSLSHSTDNFVRVHSDDLMSQVDHTVEKLRETQEEDEVPSTLASYTDQAVTLAQRASDALDRLRLNPADAAVGADVERALDAVKQDAAELADRI